MSIDGKILALAVLAIAGGCIAGYIAFSKDGPMGAGKPQQVSSMREDLWKDFGTGEQIAQTDPSQGAQDLTMSPPQAVASNELEAIASQIAAVEPAAGDSQQEPTCAFNEYVNKEMNQTLIDGLAELDRPYRILAPGSIYTQDFSPARINFNIDEKNVILDVWCG